MVEKEIFEKYFNDSYPLGPIEAPPAQMKERQFQKLIFDEQNDLFKSLNNEITLIVGRKGSGKTSLLNSVWFENEQNHSVTITLDSEDTADIFSRILTEINELAPETAMVEQISSLWEVLIWGVVLKTLRARFNSITIDDYLEGYGIKDFIGTPYELIDRQIQTISSFPPSARPVPEKVRYVRSKGITFFEVRDVALKYLKETQTNVYVLMDSLENYSLHKTPNARAVAGLLRCIGRITSEKIPLVLRCCVPSEKYHELLELSQNPIKDFQGAILLHWNAGDLLKMSAKRYSAYLSHYHLAEYRQIFGNIDFDQREASVKFWNKIFPHLVVNRNEHEENPIAYILRHTQLLPRHILLILSNILKTSIKVDKRPFSVTSERIVEGVYYAEDMIKNQILEAYQDPLEQAKTICEQILRELKTHFTWSEFDRVVSRHRKGAMRRLDRSEMMSALIEIGAVGTLILETNRYFIAVFEYMVPLRLQSSSRDEFCIHPVFTEAYGANSTYQGAKPVYAYPSKIVPNEFL